MDELWPRILLLVIMVFLAVQDIWRINLLPRFVCFLGFHQWIQNSRTTNFHEISGKKYMRIVTKYSCTRTVGCTKSLQSKVYVSDIEDET